MCTRKPAVLESKDCKQKLNEFKSRCKKHEQAKKETKPVGVFTAFKKILRLKNKFCNLLLFPEKKSSKISDTFRTKVGQGSVRKTSLAKVHTLR